MWLKYPKPVIETKKVSDANPSAVIITIVDNEVSRDNVEKFGKSRGYGVDIRQDGKDFYLTMTPNANPVVDGSCEPMSYGNRVILMTKDYLGEGSEELGRNLMKTFWVCMLEADVKPSKIYFINSSVKMVVNDSVHLENIKKLADLGVEIAACGICLDYYGVKEELGVGSITNMYAITNAILGDNIVKL
ncbi:MAG: sulfurtransferase-like selenium metabolism protein YedF [Veillonella sp.]